jgi:tape measure domain-containing protein
MVDGNDGLHSEATLGIENIRKNVDEALKLFAKLQTASAGALSGGPSGQGSGLSTAQLNLQNMTRATRRELERLKLEEQQLLNQQARTGASTADLTQRFQANRLAQQELRMAAAAARGSMTAASGSYREAQQRLTQLGNQIRNVSGGFAASGPIQQARIREYNKLNEELKKFDATMGNHQRNVGNYKSALSGIGGELAGMASGYLSAATALQTLLTNTMEFQRIKTPLTFILGSDGAANAKLAELKQLANDLGLEYFTLAKTYKSFSAAARASNFDLESSEKIFKSVTKASAVLGLSSDQLEGALLALQQMISKGNVQSEELRGQLGERLPGAFSLAAKAMGKTEKELGKLLQTGSVTANDLLPKLADQLDRSYGDKAANGVSGLNAELGKLYSVIQSFSGEGSFLSQNLFEPIVRGARLVVTELQNMTRGSVFENIRYMFTFSQKGIDRQNAAYDLRDNLKNNTSILGSAKKKSYTGSTLGDLKTEISSLDAAYRKATEEYDKFRKGIKSGDLKESGTATVKYYSEIAKGLESERDRAAASYKNLIKNQVSSNKEIADSALTTITDIRKRISALQKLDGSAIAGSATYERIQALQERLKKPADTTKAELAKYNAIEKKAKDLGDKLGEFRKKSVCEQLDGDAKEAASIKDKYDAMRDQVNEFYSVAEHANKKIKINGQLYNKNQALGLINADQKTETGQATYNNATDELKKNLEKQKGLYADFEDAKDKIGKEAAVKSYKDRINTGVSYSKAIKAELDKIPEQSKRTPQEERRFLLLSENYEAATDAERKTNETLLADYQTYSQQKEAIQRKYLKRAADLRALGKDHEAQAVVDAGAEDLEKLSNTFLEKSKAYKRAADEAVIMTREETLKQVAELNKILESGVLPPEQVKKVQASLSKLRFTLKIGVDEGNVKALQDEFNRVSAQLHVKDDKGNDIILSEEDYKAIITRLAEIQGKIDDITNPKSGKAKSTFAKGLEENFKYLKGTTKEFTEGASEDLSQLSSGFGELSSALGGNNTQAGYLLDTIGQLAKAGSDAVGAFGAFASGDIIGGITKTVSAVTSILSIGKKVKEMNAAARKEVADFYDNAIKGEVEYQELLRKRDIDAAARGKNSYQAIIAQLEAIKKQSPELEKAYSKVFDSLQGQQSVEGMGYQHGTWLRKAKTWDILASLAGSDYGKLEELYTQGKLKDAAKTDFESLKALKDQLQELGVNIEDLQKQLGELLTGTSIFGLSDGLRTLFENGTRSAQDFGKSFEEIIRNSLLSTFQAKYLEDALTPFYNELAEMMKGATPTDAQIAALKDKYIKVGQEADEYLKNIEKITGKDLTSGNATTKQGISGAIVGEALKEDTANRAMGLWQGQYDQIKKVAESTAGLYRIGVDQLNYSMQTAANTKRGADNTDGLGEKLDAIIANTDPDSSGGTSLSQALRNSGIK